MRIVFMGTPEFAVQSLRRLLDERFDVALVVTAPDRPKGRGQKVLPGPVKEFAVRHDLPVLQPANLRDPGFLQSLQRTDADLFVVVAFRILPPEVYSLPPKGSFNLHASLLPKYRGAAPIQWAVINGEKETGVTTFFLQETVDTGSVIAQERVPIGDDETSGQLHDRLAERGAGLVVKTVRLIETGSVNPVPQDNALATPAPKIFKDDCRIDWTQPASMIHNLVRGLAPSPGAWTMSGQTMLKIFHTRPELLPEREGGSLAPGTIISADQQGLIVKTGDGVISILEIQQQGRRRMSTSEFLRGYALERGQRLG